MRVNAGHARASPEPCSSSDDSRSSGGFKSKRLPNVPHAQGRSEWVVQHVLLGVAERAEASPSRAELAAMGQARTGSQGTRPPSEGSRLHRQVATHRRAVTDNNRASGEPGIRCRCCRCGSPDSSEPSRRHRALGSTDTRDRPGGPRARTSSPAAPPISSEMRASSWRDARTSGTFSGTRGDAKRFQSTTPPSRLPGGSETGQSTRYGAISAVRIWRNGTRSSACACANCGSHGSVAPTARGSDIGRPAFP